ncbi:MAG: DUF1080 domain-containing protein [Bacteroidota bacterium]
MKDINILSISIKVFIILFLLITTTCSQKNKSEKVQSQNPEQIIKEISDGILLFNGKTLDGWEVTQFGTEGPVMVSEGIIVINYGDGCSGITWTKDFPKVNYEVTLEARKTVGNDFFCGITFPVNDEFCSLIIGGWGGPVVGLSCIDGLDASENETNILKRFDKDVWYKVKLQVSDEKITAWIDDEKLVNFTYSGHELSIRPEVSLSKPFGICTWITTAELRNIVLKDSD